MKKFNFNFDITWKGIILVIIVLAFLLSVVDRVSARTVPENRNERTSINRMVEFQTIEDRLLKIRKEEDDSWSDSWIRVYDVREIDEDHTLYKYRWYDGYTRRLIDRDIALSNGLVDDIYDQNLVLTTDSIWENSIERICSYYIGR